MDPLPPRLHRDVVSFVRRSTRMNESQERAWFRYKQQYVVAVLHGDLPDDPALARLLRDYFPAPLRERFAAAVDGHPLRREIIATALTNRAVNTAGVTGLYRLAEETGAPVIPTAIWGPQRIYSVGRPTPDGKEPPPDWTRGRRVDIAFGKSLQVEPGADLTEATARIGTVLTEMLEGLQQLPYHRPRPGEYAPWYPAHLGGHAPDRVEAESLEDLPSSAVWPTWGPPL